MWTLYPYSMNASIKSMDVIMVLGMDALANGLAGSMDVIMLWAWMHWSTDGLVSWALTWFGHECTGQ